MGCYDNAGALGVLSLEELFISRRYHVILAFNKVLRRRMFIDLLETCHDPSAR